MTRRDVANFSILFGVFLGLIFAATVLSKTPRADRDWKPKLTRVASFEGLADGRYHLDALRDYKFASGGVEMPGWREAEINASDIAEMWFFVEPFSGNPLFAHSFLSFVFEGDGPQPTVISVSIEARLEKGETYTALAGTLRNYELMYVWSTERDITTRIAVGLDHELYAYKVELEPQHMRRIFEYFVRRTNELAERPRFYNTLHSNCTNELAKAVNEAFPNALPWHKSWVMTGRSAEWLFDLGFIENHQADSFSTLNDSSEVRELIKAHADATDFADAWRTAFRDGSSANDLISSP